MDSVVNVKDIFNDIYNVFYLKWKDVKSEADILQMWEEAKKLRNKHNDKYDLCKDNLLKLCNIIEEDYKRRNNYG
jgi:hypothetical protein